jgi:hypothetical protein
VRTPELAVRSVSILAVSLLVAGVAAGAAPAAIARARSAGPITSASITGLLAGVAATSASNAWAVGYGGAQTTKTLILRWNGTSWTRS